MLSGSMVSCVFNYHYLYLMITRSPANLPLYPSSLPLVHPPAQIPSQPTHAGFKVQLHNTQTSIESHIDKGCGVFIKHDTIKRDVSLLRELLETTPRHDVHNREVELGSQCEPEMEEEFAGADVRSGDDDARSMRTIVPHELERVDKDKKQFVRWHHEEEEDEEERRWGIELTRPRMLADGSGKITPCPTMITAD